MIDPRPETLFSVTIPRLDRLEPALSNFMDNLDRAAAQLGHADDSAARAFAANIQSAVQTFYEETGQ